MGADKGGLYSYVWLEALLDCRMENADTIHPDWVNIQAGEKFLLCPEGKGPPPYEVSKVEQGKALILGHRALSEAEKSPGSDWADTWAFIVQPLEDGTSRLIIRTRNARLAGWMQAIEPGVFIMELGLMNGVKARAEGNQLDPSEEALFRLVFGILLLFYLVIRYTSWFFRTGISNQKSEREQPKKTANRLLEWLVVILLIPAFIYPLKTWLDVGHVDLPAGLRWIGAGLFLIGDILLLWARKSLGKGWSTAKGSDAPELLVTNGAYRRIRHPMYLAMLLITLGMFLLSSNLIVGLPYLIAVFFMYRAYVESEEAALVEIYGDEYRDYQRRTGRLLPVIGIRSGDSRKN